MLASGMTTKEVLEQYPQLEERDLLACIAYGSEMSRERYVEISRVAFENMQEALEQQLSNLPPEKRKKLMEEAKVQAQENVTGSRRP